MRRALALGGAAVALAAAAVLLLLAADVRSWESRIAQDDLVFRQAPAEPDLWEAREVVPGGAARTLLRIDDDLAFRHALRLFRLGRPRLGPEETPVLDAKRGEAQTELSEVGRADPEAARRSQASNLLGVLALNRRGAQSDSEQVAALERGISSFRKAVELDDANERAKFNLELALRRSNPPNLEGTIVPRDSPGGAGLKKSGSGY